MSLDLPVPLLQRRAIAESLRKVTFNMERGSDRRSLKTHPRARNVPPDRTVWVSARSEPPATATITWGVDAGDTTTIDLTGELCILTVSRVRQLIQEAADASPANVAIDMSAVTFIDARGLSLLLLTQNRLAERGLRCQFVSPSHAVRRLFNILGLESE